MFNNLKIIYHQGKQFIPDVTTAQVPGIFRGRPIISTEKVDENELKDICPMDAISINPIRLDMGRCTFCGECARQFPRKIRFTKEYKISSNERERLVVQEGEDKPIEMNTQSRRKEIRSLFSQSLKLRQVSAGGDNSCEWELSASNNVQFDLSRFGIEFVASPRHSDGILVTGPINENMAKPLRIAYDAIPEPKLFILCGVDAISGGIFANSEVLERSVLNDIKIDLYIPGNPSHPLTIINGLVDFTRKK
ncbi:MAG TPA: NADH:ubiquinone oxidoreductase [Bacteroidales bacterium]|nr:NADH:ubiquinone oxidoreductase [Bacteroidales bacterium]